MSGRSGNTKHIFFGLWSIFIIFDKSCLLRMPKFAQNPCYGGISSGSFYGTPTGIGL